MPFTLASGTRIYWTKRGEGPPVLLIMGLSFTHEMWFRLTPALLDAGYQTILFDNRGMGRSDTPPGPYRMRHMALDAVAVLDAAEVESAHVIGASMGGMIAQELAIRFPGRVRALLLGCTSSSGLFGRWPEWRYVPGLQIPRSASADRERAFRRMLYADTTPDERVEEDIAVRCRCSWTPKGFWSQLAGILLWSSFRNLPRITSQTLVIHGDHDRLIPPWNGRMVASRIPGARFHLVENAGHILTTDQPEQCNRLMLDFLAEHRDREERLNGSRGLVGESGDTRQFHAAQKLE